MAVSGFCVICSLSFLYDAFEISMMFSMTDDIRFIFFDAENMSSYRCDDSVSMELDNSLSKVRLALFYM